MKDYLNSEERKQVISILHMLNEGLFLIQGKTLTKEELANIKRGFTFTKKAIESLKERLNQTAKDMLLKDIKKSKVYLDIYNATEDYARKKKSDIIEISE